jgi:hypothetical protein
LYHEAPELPDGGVFRGVDALAARTRGLVEAVGHFQYDVRSLEGRGEHVLAAIDLSAEGADSGAALTRTFFYVVWLRGGRFRELRAYGDADQARLEYERLAVAPDG